MNEDAKLILTAPNVVCPKCGSKFFKEIYAIKKISAIISPTGQEEFMPIPMMACAYCNESPDEYKNKRNFKVITGEAQSEDEEATPKSSIIMP